MSDLSERIAAKLDRYADDLDAELRVMTGKELRQFARENHVALGYAAGRKATMRNEIVLQMRNREYGRLLAEEVGA